ncbi:hypothetical protein [Alienimonas chondri]|uniref:Uncharacterized protein n=1 Tax=Alienimonas chondri TaxID=2681879 RepID=A0ABX1VED0_9PLAN|nr:hypothetical protein [Alienimonas chondri]NNJ26148.1 hypothetical protein [Alienimonas chondri]
MPTRFEPRFLDGLDGRVGIVKELRCRYDELKTAVGADSPQKDYLCERLCWLLITLETAETRAIEGEPFDANKYTVLLNSALGLFRTLGIDAKAKNVPDLKTYLAAGGAKGAQR